MDRFSSIDSTLYGPTSEHGGCILVVDDNPLIVNILRNILASNDYTVYTGSNGEEALEVLKLKNIDLIISDVMMPRMDGYTLHQQVRASSEFSHIPFIFLTALSDQGEVHKGWEVGVDEYLTKPFEPADLLSLIKGKLVRSRALRQDIESRYDVFRKKVIHTLSHEFRTPLVAINTGTELLLDARDGLTEEKMRNLLQAIRRGGERLERLVTDFMLLQQFEAGITARMAEQHKRLMPINEVVRAFYNAQREELEELGFQCTFECHLSEDRGLWITMYEAHFLEMLRRVFNNAIKFSVEKKEILLQCFKQENEVFIEVKDRGIGINPLQAKEAIDVFGQINRETYEQQGGGLGLALASRYASLYHGRVEFELRKGGGTTVSLIFPEQKNPASH